MTEKNTKIAQGSSDKKAWSKPQLRSVVPASHTRGGAFPAGPREDASYRLS